MWGATRFACISPKRPAEPRLLENATGHLICGREGTTMWVHVSLVGSLFHRRSQNDPEKDRSVDRQRTRQTEKQTGRQTVRQTDRLAGVIVACRCAFVRLVPHAGCAGARSIILRQGRRGFPRSADEPLPHDDGCMVRAPAPCTVRIAPAPKRPSHESPARASSANTSPMREVAKVTGIVRGIADRLVNTLSPCHCGARRLQLSSVVVREGGSVIVRLPIDV